MTNIENKTNEQLFEEYTYVVYSCYKKLYKDDFILNNREDILQEGFFGLWKGILTYNPATEMKLMSYLYTCSKNAMLTWIRKNKSYYAYNDPYEQDVEDMSFTESQLFGVESSDSDIITLILKIYKEWICNTKRNMEGKITKRLCRANMLLSEAVKHSSVSQRYLEDACGISRSVVAQIFSELRKAIQYYKEGKITICLTHVSL